MNNIRVPIIIGCTLFPLLLASCSSTNDRPKPIEVFQTQISQDGTKVFVYRLERPENPGAERVRSAGPRGNRDHGEGPAGRNGNNGEGKKGRSRGPSDAENKGSKHGDFKLDEGLTAVLAENGFCREGYYELDRYQALGDISLRGECKDTATENDRRNFPNSQ